MLKTLETPYCEIALRMLEDIWPDEAERLRRRKGEEWYWEYRAFQECHQFADAKKSILSGRGLLYAEHLLGHQNELEFYSQFSDEDWQWGD